MFSMIGDMFRDGEWYLGVLMIFLLLLVAALIVFLICVFIPSGKTIQGEIVDKQIVHGTRVVPVGKVMVPQSYTDYNIYLDNGYSFGVSPWYYEKLKKGDTIKAKTSILGTCMEWELVSPRKNDQSLNPIFWGFCL